jgi:hypothetical protein
MIQGKNLSDALLVLQSIGKVQSSGILFLGKEWLVLRTGNIVHASVSMSFLLFGFRSLPWKWFPCEVVSSEGTPVYNALIETLHGRLRFKVPECR